jgi:hypothetical protein
MCDIHWYNIKLKVWSFASFFFHSKLLKQEDILHMMVIEPLEVFHDRSVPEMFETCDNVHPV